MGKDYYKILGVGKTATAEEIKKAFRTKAHQYHPDKPGGDEAKFKELNEAYQVLGDSKKRAQYDQFGSAFEHAQAGGGFQGFEGFRDFSGFASGFNQGQNGSFQFDFGDLGDLFGQAFGFGSPRSSSGGAGGETKRGGRKSRGRDIEATMTIDFLESVFGAEKEIKLNKSVTCTKCGGGGAEPGSKVETCRTCNGAGAVNKVQRTILGNIQTRSTCDTCAGEGKIHSQKCSRCYGSGVTREVASLSVKIPAGIDHGQAIRLSGQGEAGERGAAAGDLYLKIKVTPSRDYSRQGDNIVSTLEIGFKQAALGDRIEVKTVDGPVTLKIPEGTQSGKVFILRDKGVPKLNTRGRGDHLVTVIVKTPTRLSREQRKILDDLNI